jgi:hypothetical protein
VTVWIHITIGGGIPPIVFWRGSDALILGVMIPQ